MFGLHVVAKSHLHLYQHYPWLDNVMHLAGGVAIAFFFLVSWRAAVASGRAGRPAAMVTGLLVASLTCAAAVGWEFVEYLSDRLLHTSMQMSLEDTLSDLALGIVGGLAVAAAAWWRSR
ncbi:MAG: hypothetical protein ACREAA_00680 [Candidatus Polarisedimenticolia bacterium]